jgi:hypothetical protein
MTAILGEMTWPQETTSIRKVIGAIRQETFTNETLMVERRHVVPWHHFP